MPVARSQKVAQEIRRYGPQVITIALCSALAFGLAWKTDASSQLSRFGPLPSDQ